MNLGDLQPLLEGWQTNELIIINFYLFIVDLWCYLCLVHHYMKKLSVFFKKNKAQGLVAIYNSCDSHSEIYA